MTRIDSPALPLLARLFLAALFVQAGFSKLTDPAGTIGYIAHVGLPFPTLAYAIALVAEIGGGIAIVLGLFTPVVALALAVFTVATAFGFHYPMSDMSQFINFWKNMSITGGFLALAANGAGAWSLDAMLARRRGFALA
jgi:putative oxidoreductase